MSKIDKSRIYRIIQIIEHIKENPCSTKSLAARLGTDIRNIQRDFKEYILPLYPDITKYKNRYHLDDTKSDIDLISHYKIDIEDISGKLKDIQNINNAIKIQTILKCKYTTPKGTYKLKLKPLKFTNYSSYWYLIAIDVKDNKLKKYYFKKISNIQNSNITFIYDISIDKVLATAISIWFNPTKKPYEVQLLISANIAKYFIRKPLPTQRVMKKYPNGDIELSLYITSDMEILPIIKSYLPYIKVIEPKRIAEKITNDLLKYLNDK